MGNMSVLLDFGVEVVNLDGFVVVGWFVELYSISGWFYVMCWMVVEGMKDIGWLLGDCNVMVYVINYDGLVVVGSFYYDYMILRVFCWIKLMGMIFVD